VQRDNATSVHFASLQSALKELYCLQKCRLCNHACAWNLVKAFCNLMIIFICKNQKTKPRTVINENIISYGSRQMENLYTINSGNSLPADMVGILVGGQEGIWLVGGLMKLARSCYK